MLIFRLRMRNDFSFSCFSLFSEAWTINSRAEDVFWMKIENKHRKAKFIHLFQIISTKIKNSFLSILVFHSKILSCFWTLMYADVFKFDATNVKTMREFNMTCWCLAKISRKEKGLWKRKITRTITLFPCSGGVVDVPEPEYGRRWPRIIPKPLILSAPVTYQPMLPTHNVWLNASTACFYLS